MSDKNKRRFMMRNILDVNPVEKMEEQISSVSEEKGGQRGND